MGLGRFFACRSTEVKRHNKKKNKDP